MINTNSPKKAVDTLVKEERMLPKTFNPLKLVKRCLDKKVHEKQIKLLKKRQQETFEKFKMLYTLIMNIDKQLPNRHTKKQYWRDFIHNKGQIQKKLFFNIMNNANPDKNCQLINKNDLKLNKTKLIDLLIASEVDTVKRDIIIEELAKIKLSEIVI